MVDDKNLTQKIPKTHGYGNITRQVYVYPSDINNGKYTMDDIMALIMQSYDTTQ
jgi:hypothetical protein